MIGRAELEAAAERVFAWKALREHQLDAMQAIRAGEAEYVFLAPEQLLKDGARTPFRLELAMLVVDEAHCVSAWGHDFRPGFCGWPTWCAGWGPVRWWR